MGHLDGIEEPILAAQSSRICWYSLLPSTYLGSNIFLRHRTMDTSAMRAHQAGSFRVLASMDGVQHGILGSLWMSRIFISKLHPLSSTGFNPDGDVLLQNMIKTDFWHFFRGTLVALSNVSVTRPELADRALSSTTVSEGDLTW